MGWFTLEGNGRLNNPDSLLFLALRIDSETDSKSNKMGNNKMNQRFAVTNLVVGILTLIGIAIYTGISAWQTWLIRTNNIVSQRAFVISGLSVGFEPVVDISKKEVFLQLQVPVENVGNTATTALTMFVKCAFSANKPQFCVVVPRTNS